MQRSRHSLRGITSVISAEVTNAGRCSDYLLGYTYVLCKLSSYRRSDEYAIHSRKSFSFADIDGFSERPPPVPTGFGDEDQIAGSTVVLG